VAIYLVVDNFDALTGATSGIIPYLPLLIPVAAFVGLAVWALRRDGADVEIGVEAPPAPAPPVTDEAREPAALQG
jgi:hypothetical protein